MSRVIVTLMDPMIIPIARIVITLIAHLVKHITTTHIAILTVIRMVMNSLLV